MAKRTLLVTSAVFLLGLLALTIVLVGAHRQIRAIEPPLPQLHLIQSALPHELGLASISYVNTATQSGPLGTIGHVGVLLEWADGRVFLIDTGMPPDRAQAFGAPMETLLGADPTETHGSLDAQLGDAVNAITGVGFTHLHSDHTDGLPPLCAAQREPATLYQTRLQKEQLNFGTQPGEDNILAASCPRQVVGDEVLKEVPGYPGLLMIAAGGHTPGSTVFAARYRVKVWVFSGDITNDRQSLLDNTPKHWAYRTFIVPEYEFHQEQLRLWLASMIVDEGFEVMVSHDIGAWEASDLEVWH